MSRPAAPLGRGFGLAMDQPVEAHQITRAEMEHVQSLVFEHLEAAADRLTVMQALFQPPHATRYHSDGRRIYGRD